MFESLSSSLISWAITLIHLFPASPIQPALTEIRNSAVTDVLQYVNWFVPIGTIITILSGWLTAVAAYYVYQIVLRWIKVIE